MHLKNMTGAGISVAGRIRDYNEDSFIADDRNQIYIVADGVGGNKAGEVASNFVTERLYKQLLKSNRSNLSKADMLAILNNINDELLNLSAKREDYKGMSTTLVFLINQVDKLLICNIGDSRAYQFRNGKLTQISKDHSIVQQLIDLNKITPEDAQDHPLKHYITMVLGSEPLKPDFFEIETADNDIILLCTDGLTDMLPDEQIEAILRDNESLTDSLTCLKDKALENGGHDNLTIVLAKT